MSYDLVNTEDLSRLIRHVKELKDQLIRTLDNDFSQKWVDGEKVCKLLGICKRTLWDLRKSGKLKYSQFGRKILFRVSDVDAFIETNYR